MSAREAGKRLRPGFQSHLASPPSRDLGKAVPLLPESVSRFDGTGRSLGCLPAAPRPARRNLVAWPAGPGESLLARAQGEAAGSGGAGIYRGDRPQPPPARTPLLLQAGAATL